MLNVIKEVQGNALIVRMSGVMDETVNLQTLLGQPAQKEIHLYLREITRINSLGVKLWIKYFHGIEASNIGIKVFEASPVIVGQLNLMLNFIPKAGFESLCAPYHCPQCKTQFIAVYRIAQLKAHFQKMPEMKCPKCSGNAEFDDIESEYFAFLTRQT